MRQRLHRAALRAALLISVALTLLLCAACDDDSPTKPRLPLTQGKIVFMSSRDGPYDIFLMNADGSGQTKLTNLPVWNDTPVWSPDGTLIAWSHSRDENGGIYRMNSDGSGQINLTPGVFGYEPSWSPNGYQIAFSAVAQTDGFYSEQIFVLNRDGSGLTRLTQTKATSFNPHWSPDGSKLLFLSNVLSEGSDLDVLTMNADGTNVLNLTNTKYLTERDPAWSPDGKQIAYVGWPGGGIGSEVYIVDENGSNTRRITNDSATDRGPTWSPDGQSIAVNRDGGPFPIMLLRADGTGAPTQVTDNGWDQSWSPDGKRIVFTSDRNGNWDIYSINPNGTLLRQLTNTAGGNQQPQWAAP